MQCNVRVWLQFAAIFIFLVPITAIALFSPSSTVAQSLFAVTGNRVLTQKSNTDTLTRSMVGSYASALDRGTVSFSGFGESLNISDVLVRNILPKWANLDYGFSIVFSNSLTTGVYSADYLLPLQRSTQECFFLEAHTEYLGYRRTKSNAQTQSELPFGVPVELLTSSMVDSYPNRYDLSFGGGYRRLLVDSTLIGFNSFFDASRLYNNWYSSWGWGLEFCAIGPYNSAIDLHFNQYGNLFRGHAFLDAFRAQGTSLDFGGGYSMPLFDQRLDLRFGVDGYRFVLGDQHWGWRGTAELATRDGLATLRYEHGRDTINQSYDSVGAYINLAFDSQNLLNWGNPFTLPEPVFKNSRNMERNLTAKVRRNWHQPSAVILSRSAAAERSMTLVAQRLVAVTLNAGTVGSILVPLTGIGQSPIPQNVANSARKIIVRLNVSGTSLTSLRIGLGNVGSNAYYDQGAPDIGNGSGTFTYELTPGQFTALVDAISFRFSSGSANLSATYSFYE